MRIRARPSRRRLDRVTINLASMIDVSFLILFYFMVAAMLDDRQSRLSTALQTEGGDAGPASDFQVQNIEVRLVDAKPAYRLGGRVLHSREELRQALAPLPRAPGVFVRVFGSVPVGFAVAAVQVAHDAGFEMVTYVPAD
jgi:biopolymer transport protein ExbD